MSDKLCGPYKILPVAIEEEAATGANLHPLPFQNVRVSAPADVWIITPTENDTYHLSIRDSYPYTGVLEDKQQVIVTVDKQDNREWNITRVVENGPYVITLSGRLLPAPAWTLAKPEPDADIVLRPYPVGPITPKEQLFKLVPVDN